MHRATQQTDGLTWIYPKIHTQLKDNIAKEFNIHPASAQILVTRGFIDLKEVHDFLYAKLPDLHDPFLLNEMPQAVERILTAIENDEHILIYGDNDVDGMTATALLTEFLRSLGAKVYYYISQRSLMRECLIVEALDYAQKKQCKLLITVDCGITAAVEIAKVVKAGVDVIVTDHHEPTDTIPHCVATLNPKLVGSTYPNREITGVGVAFKLAHATVNTLAHRGALGTKKIDLKRYLDLVALGTVSDMGALKGENRILVRYGLEALRRTKRIGLAKLIHISDCNILEINTLNIVTKIAPRLNSLGRIDDPLKGVEMLLIRNPVDAERLAFELDINNLERQKIERAMSLSVEDLIEKDPHVIEEKAICMCSKNWHPGVIAILSTRISKQYSRPSVMIAIEKGIGKGSLRSIPEFPLLPQLKKLSHLLINFGGHDFAAGLTLHEKNIPLFFEEFQKAAQEILKDSDVLNKLYLDAEVEFCDLTFDFMESLRLIEPHGNQNPPPILYADAVQAWPPKIIGKSHLKFYLMQNDRVLEGIAFDKGHLARFYRKKGLKLRVAFTPQINFFQGSSIQLMIRDFKIIN